MACASRVTSLQRCRNVREVCRTRHSGQAEHSPSVLAFQTRRPPNLNGRSSGRPSFGARIAAPVEFDLFEIEFELLRIWSVGGEQWPCGQALLFFLLVG